MLKSVVEINDKNKRYMATFSDGKMVKFGLTNPKQGTYIDHKDKTLRKNYIKRHLKDLNTYDFTRAGYLSLFLLWNKKTLKESMRDYNRRILKNDWDIKI